MKTRITQLTVAPEGADLYDDRSTHIEIDDEGGGEFIKVVQPCGNAEIRIDPSEWPVIRRAIDKLFKECNK